MVSSHMSIFGRKESYSWQNAVFKQMYQFWQNERGWCMNISGFGFANGMILNWTEREQMRSNNYSYYYRWQQNLTEQHFNMSINRVSMIFSPASWVIRSSLDCYKRERNFLQPLLAKPITVPSLHCLDDGREWSVKDSWSCILGNLGGNWFQTVTNKVLAALIGKTETDMLAAPS